MGLTGETGVKLGRRLELEAGLVRMGEEALGGMAVKFSAARVTATVESDPELGTVISESEVET